MIYEKKIPESLRNQVINIRLVNAKFPQIAVTLNINLNIVKKIYYRYEKTNDYVFASRSSVLKKFIQYDLIHIKHHIHHDHE